MNTTNMFGKGKKIVSLAYKEKLLAEIAHYERRIDEALHKRKQTSFEDESSDEDSNTNPYKLNVRQSGYELKQQEASLSDRASMTLELAMLTIMQSEVNVMVTPPAVRRPVNEDGIWLEVAAECKIDLVSFTITFYAHKPHRKFAPIRYRNVAVDLVKPAHKKELSQSVLPKLNRPNLALQVLQSYATAFRSRRTTLLELAEKYDDKLRMEAMPEGGYRVRFLNLLQVDWTLENLWSPIVPFCHRMKFEVEYMPKDYIHIIGKLYKQFKDPSLETPERTLILARIFDTCLQAQGPAREIQDSFESDPDTAGRLHDRRTTIDQEPDIPNVASPQKPKGKENKPLNRKTTMEPPKTIPKKAKKDAKYKDKDVVYNKKGARGIENDTTGANKLNAKDVSENLKGIEDVETDSNNAKKTNAKDVAEISKGVKSIEDSTNTVKKSKGKEKGIENKGTDVKKLNAKDLVDNRKGARKEIDDSTTAKKVNAKDVAENRKGVKRTIKNGGGNNAKKTRTDEGIVNSKSKPGLKGGKDDVEDNGETGTVISINKAQKKGSGKNVKETDIVDTDTSENDAMKKGSDNSQIKSNQIKSKVYSVSRPQGHFYKSESTSISQEETAVEKKAERNSTYNTINLALASMNSPDPTNGTRSRSSVKTKAVSGEPKDTKGLKKGNKEDGIGTTSKKSAIPSAAKNNEIDIASSKSIDVENNISSKKDAENIAKTKNVGSKQGTKNSKNSAYKDENTVSGAVSINKTSKGVKAQNIANSRNKGTESDHTDTVDKGSSKNVSKEAVAKLKESTVKDKNKQGAQSKNPIKNGTKVVNVGGKLTKNSEGLEKAKNDMTKPASSKDINTAKPKEGAKQVVNKKTIGNEITKNHSNKQTNVTEIDKDTEKGKGDKEKLTDNAKISNNDQNKETMQSLAEKNKIMNPMTAGQKSDQNKNNKTTTKNNEQLIKKNMHKQPDAKLSKNKNDNKQVKQSATDKTDKDKNINSKLSQNANNILKEKTNRNETTQKGQKNNMNDKNKATFKKPEKKNTDNPSLVTKSKNIAITKLSTETQIKLADKLKTKIPMMKNKLKLSALSQKVLPNNMGTISRISSGVEKTKIPKSLPVFKKVVKNLPTRISPRKLASTFKPSSRGFSNK